MVKKEEVKKIDDSRCKLEFRLHDRTMSKEESVITKIKKTFSNKKMLPQHCFKILNRFVFSQA